MGLSPSARNALRTALPFGPANEVIRLLDFAADAIDAKAAAESKAPAEAEAVVETPVKSEPEPVATAVEEPATTDDPADAPVES
jgi:hypothetical protein